MTSVGGMASDADSLSEKLEVKYQMNYPKRGRFIIFNNTTFNVIGEQLKVRSGSGVDSKNLKDLFEKVLLFDVEVRENLTSGQMEHVMSLEAEKDHSSCDCFGIAVLTYEEKEGVLYGSDVPITIDRILKPIKTCPSLFGKPKLCFIQACKRVETMKQTNVEADGGLKASRETTIRIPLEADFLYVYSSVPGIYSWKECDRGSWFIEALTDKLTRLAYEDIDLVRILTRVIHQVAQELSKCEKQKQKLPSITSMLTKDVYFTKKP